MCGSTRVRTLKQLGSVGYHQLMSYQFYIDQEHHCAIIRFIGKINHDEIKAQATELIASPQYTKDLNFLRDLTQASLVIGDGLASVKELVSTRSFQLDDEIGRNRKSAWVLSNAQDFKKIHQFCALSRISHSIIARQPFRDVGRAKKWLGFSENYECNYK